jgi:hypothetical protein
MIDKLQTTRPLYCPVRQPPATQLAVCRASRGASSLTAKRNARLCRATFYFQERRDADTV